MDSMNKPAPDPIIEEARWQLVLADMRQRASVPVGLVGGRPVYPIMGGAVDGPDDEPEDDEPDDEDEDKPDAKDDDDSDLDDEADIEKLRASIKAERKLKREAVAQAAEQRRKRKESEDKIKANAGTPDEAAKAIEDARVAAREPLIRKLLTASARSAFLTAGFQGEVSERFIKLIDRDALDIDDDGEIDGLDEQVAQIKRDFPEKFKRKRTGPGDTGKADRDAAPKGKSASERQADALMRK